MNRILFSLLLLTTFCFAQNNTFLPLEVDNYWQFTVRSKGDDLGKVTYNYGSMAVLKDTLINNQKYFKVKMPGHYFIYPLFLRYDSSSNTIKEFPTEYPVDSALTFLDFNANLNDSFLYGLSRVRCIKIDSAEVFGDKKYVKGYIFGDIPSYYIELAENFGPIYIIHDESYVITLLYYFDLKYAKVNGQEYGDPTSIENIIIPHKFSLEQNFPNPFNPSTKIKYSIDHPSNVTLKIYSLNGQEVQTLVNQHQSAGDYQVVFNADGLSSGIYIYKIKIDDRELVRKMVLIK